MKTGMWLVVPALIGPALVACGDEEGPAAATADGTGGSVATGGKAATGGGSATGGAAGSGGVNADASAGGLANTGGANAGGAGTPGDSGAGGNVTTDSGPTGPAPRVTALSQTGHDRLFGVTRDAAGNIYTTGQISSAIDATADFSVLVAKFSPNGDLASGFGTGGVATKNVAIGGTSRELGRGIVVQSTRKIVVAGTAEHDPTS